MCGARFFMSLTLASSFELGVDSFSLQRAIAREKKISLI